MSSPCGGRLYTWTMPGNGYSAVLCGTMLAFLSNDRARTQVAVVCLPGVRWKNVARAGMLARDWLCHGVTPTENGLRGIGELTPKMRVQAVFRVQVEVKRG